MTEIPLRCRTRARPLVARRADALHLDCPAPAPPSSASRSEPTRNWPRLTIGPLIVNPECKGRLISARCDHGLMNLPPRSRAPRRRRWPAARARSRAWSQQRSSLLLLSRGGYQNRWHLLGNCDHGHSRIALWRSRAWHSTPLDLATGSIDPHRRIAAKGARFKQTEKGK
jgi:hypothetical protein